MTTSYQPFYAGGSKGKQARADGRGGLLPRGYHFQREDGEIVSTFATEGEARWAALLASVMDAQDDLLQCMIACYQGDNRRVRQENDLERARQRLAYAQAQATAALELQLSTGGQHGHR